ncbi:MAG: glycerol-3-phosphate 1-O-acyltransferase PlsY [Defluviitaleaceae bacterium]|nr:glycerol-3-phosphate 1-O-acyltransferase PlsY [Defluviitaleaceae bacterium]
MPDFMFPWIYILIGYPIGSLQFAYFVGKIIGKIDIREHGSGNAGTTNVYRVMGVKNGLIVLFFDLLKTMVPIIILHIVLYGQPWGLQSLETFEPTYYIPGLLMGFGAVLGHCFPFYLKFRGGKGVACVIGMVIMFDPRVLVIVLTISAVIVITTRFISLASTTGFISLAAVTTYFYSDYTVIVIFIWLLAALGMFTHRKNILWLITGQERRFNFRRSKT